MAKLQRNAGFQNKAPFSAYKITNKLFRSADNDLHPALRYIRRSLRREWWWQLALALALAALPVLLCWWLSRAGYEWAPAVLLLSAPGLRWLVQLVRKPAPQHHRLWELLFHNPLKIVWVYSVRTQVIPFGFYLWETGLMVFKLNDGDEISIAIPARKLKVVSRFLNKLLPHATFGYSPERQKLFEENPAQLVKPD